MDTVINFFLSILASIVATAILLITATWRSRTIRRALTAIASGLLKVEVKYVFANSKEAEEEIKDALSKAVQIRIFTSRGNEFQRDLYSPILQDSSGRKRSVKILLPEPRPNTQSTDWIEQREEELSIFDKAFGRGTLRRQIENNLTYLAPHIESGRFEIRKYNAPHIARIILTENYLFLQPYKASLHGRDCPVILYGHSRK